MYLLFIIIFDVLSNIRPNVNYKISLKQHNLCITVPRFLLWEAFLLLLPFLPLSDSADYIEGPSEKQFNSNRDFQSDLILQT